MNPFTGAISGIYRGYADFKGRSTRPAYWFAMLYQAIVWIVLGVLTSMLSDETMTHTTYRANPDGTITTVFEYAPTGAAAVVITILTVFLLAHIVPNLALITRRLHDGGFTGKLTWLIVIPLFGAIALFVVTLLPTSKKLTPAGFTNPTVPANLTAPAYAGVPQQPQNAQPFQSTQGAQPAQPIQQPQQPGQPQNAAF